MSTTACRETKHVSRVYGGGAMRGPALIGLQEYLSDNNVCQDGDITGVSIGSIVAALDTNGVSTKRQRRVFFDDLTHIKGGAILQALLLPDGTTPSLTDVMLSPLGWFRQMMRAQMSLTRLFVGQLRSLASDHCLLPPEELTEAADNILKLTGSALVDLVPVMRGLVELLDLKPNKRLKVVAYDLLAREPVIFQGEDYDLTLALSASCSVPGMMRPVCMVHDGKLRLLVDGGVWHPHPGAACNEPGAIVAKLIDLPAANMLWKDRDGDFIVTVVAQNKSFFARLDEKDVEELVTEGYDRAATALSGAIASGAIPTASETALV